MHNTKQHFQGPHAKVFWAWAALMRTMKCVLIFHENVVGFGTAEFKSVLPMYFVVRLEVDPRLEGWATNRRRHIIMAVLRCWAHDVICDGNDNDAGLKTYFDMDQAYKHFFMRECNFTWHEYMIATGGEVEDSRQWALQRSSQETPRQQDRPIWHRCPRRLLVGLHLERAPPG